MPFMALVVPPGILSVRGRVPCRSVRSPAAYVYRFGFSGTRTPFALAVNANWDTIIGQGQLETIWDGGH
ncbi:hypothetical protein CJ030_MR8G004881 [Morella rubra]|uniref:Uncharacterized protein n=1 Tax=Morella rubra TaxID=262757 RepID=A0A6A1USM2_9ROSI|nr:hypothetical protein CJ030_MR8G004881 [Morella rubra]